MAVEVNMVSHISMEFLYRLPILELYEFIEIVVEAKKNLSPKST